METRANYLIIGVFVLGLVGLLLGFIYWMKNDASGPEGKNYYVIFDGSVQGLTDASPVFFNGIRFGAVRTLELVPEDTRKVRALITLRSETPVRTNSRASLPGPTTATSCSFWLTELNETRCVVPSGSLRTPTPITQAKPPLGRVAPSANKPATLAPRHSRSFGHLRKNSPSPRSWIARYKAKPATKPI